MKSRWISLFLAVVCLAMLMAGCGGGGAGGAAANNLNPGPNTNTVHKITVHADRMDVILAIDGSDVVNLVRDGAPVFVPVAKIAKARSNSKMSVFPMDGIKS